MPGTNAKASIETEISRGRLVELLNEDLAREYQAIISSVVYSQILKGAEYMSIAAELEKHAQEELTHAAVMQPNLSSFDDLISNRVADEFAYRVDLQFPHDVGAMSFGGLHTDPKKRCRLFAASALREQLNDFTFPGRQPIAWQVFQIRLRT